jgi:hypothetical protein
VKPRSDDDVTTAMASLSPAWRVELPVAVSGGGDLEGGEEGVYGAEAEAAAAVEVPDDGPDALVDEAVQLQCQ